MTTDSAPAPDACSMVGGSDKQVVHGFHLHDRRTKDVEKMNPRLGFTVPRVPQCNVKGNANEGNLTHNICMKPGANGHALALNAIHDRNATKCPAPKS